MQTKSFRSGFTLVELLISVVLLASVLGGGLALALAGSGALSTGVTNAEVQTRVRIAVDRIARELSAARRGTLAPDPQPVPDVQGVGSATLDFERCLGAAAGVPLWSPMQRIAFEYEPGELDNGIDDDGDGLIDEGVVAWTDDVGGLTSRRVVLVTGVSELLEGELPNGADDNGNGLVDESGLVFDADGERLILRLTLERVRSDGRLAVRTSETSVLLRN